MEATLVFDGNLCRGAESGRVYSHPIEVVYTAQGQSADAYIIEQLEWGEKRKHLTVVTNDKALASHARSLGAKTMHNELFIRTLLKRKETKESAVKEERVETKDQFKRLLKLFEERDNSSH